MGQLYDLIQAHMDAQPYEVRPADVARKLGVSRQTVLNWREPTGWVSRRHLEGIAQLTGVPYLRVLDAMLEDIGYISRTPPDDPKGTSVAGEPNVS